MIFGLAVRFDRTGRHRSNFDRYFDKSWPFHYRNRAFGLIPYSIGVALLCTAFLVGEPGGRRFFVATVVGLLGLLCVPIGIVLTYRPPDWLKPQWLREEERRRQMQH